jgi:hypothetical protein
VTNPAKPGWPDRQAHRQPSGRCFAAAGHTSAGNKMRHQEADKAEPSYRGRRARGALPDEVRSVLAVADLAAERTTARVRLGVLILIGVLLAALGSLSGVYRGEIALIIALNAGVSVAAFVLARTGMFRSWVPWAVATLDAAVVLGIMLYVDIDERMSASDTPAPAVSWAIFVLLALTAMRFKPALVLDLGGLFVCGFAASLDFMQRKPHPYRQTRSAPISLGSLIPSTMRSGCR